MERYSYIDKDDGQWLLDILEVLAKKLPDSKCKVISPIVDDEKE